MINVCPQIQISFFFKLAYLTTLTISGMWMHCKPSLPNTVGYCFSNLLNFWCCRSPNLEVCDNDVQCDDDIGTYRFGDHRGP